MQGSLGSHKLYTVAMGIRRAEIKTIITDLDETLWSGVIAEGEKPKLNTKYYRFLSQMFEKGVVLIGLSKNDDEDVKSAFAALKLQKSIFVTIVANWESKASNIELLKKQLELRPETTLFIDDNPLELGEVRAKIPTLLTLQASNWQTLKKNLYLKGSTSTPKGIRDRYAKYRHALVLFKVKKAFSGTEKAFLQSRRRTIHIGEPKTQNELDRVVELFYRTNRLNINRRPLTSLNSARSYLHGLRETGYTIFAVSVTDGGTALGIQGAFTVITRGKQALISNGTISCSMISFGDFEKKIINEILLKLFVKVESVEMLVKVTATNIRIRNVLKAFGFKAIKTKSNDFRFQLSRKQFKAQDISWIRATWSNVEYKYFGIPTLKEYFLRNEWKKLQKKWRVTALGVGQGETLGTELTDRFTNRIKQLRGAYFPVDLEAYGNNIVANAENLRRVIACDSIDYVICTELLEHTEHYWKVLNEILRITKIGGRIFLSAPYNYPKHEYPIDRWRLSERYLRKALSPTCRIERVQIEGTQQSPRRTIMSLVKIREAQNPIVEAKGKVDWETGLTYI